MRLLEVPNFLHLEKMSQKFFKENGKKMGAVPISFTSNGFLDAEEKGKVSATIFNVGKGSAYNVKVRIDAKNVEGTAISLDRDQTPEMMFCKF